MKCQWWWSLPTLIGKNNNNDDDDIDDTDSLTTFSALTFFGGLRLIYVLSAMLSLLRPFRWQHLYAPVVPTSCANMIGGAIDPAFPFLIGCDKVMWLVVGGWYC